MTVPLQHGPDTRPHPIRVGGRGQDRREFGLQQLVEHPAAPPLAPTLDRGFQVDQGGFGVHGGHASHAGRTDGDRESQALESQGQRGMK